MGLGSHFECFLEAVYDYRLSYLYTLHLALVVALGLVLIYLSVREWHYRRRAYSYDAVRGHEVKSSSAWSQETDHHTAEEVRKLRESEEYRNYLEDKNRPNSHYNRKIEVEEIVFSDEEDEKNAYEARIYGQSKKLKFK